jgi:hypothetical protein
MKVAEIIVEIHDDGQVRLQPCPLEPIVVAKVLTSILPPILAQVEAQLPKVKVAPAGVLLPGPGAPK